jgi:multicomponent Na+:H+ antiporter subunit E
MDSTTPQETIDWRHYLLVFAVIFFLWYLLVGALDKSEIIAGLLVAAVVTFVTRPRLGIFAGIKLKPSAVIYLFTYLGYFFGALIKANIDMAKRVLSPSLPIRPGIVEVKTELTSSLGIMLLANSITLTPGTLSVDVIGDIIKVHWIDCPPDIDIDEATESIVHGFEHHLKGFLK